MFNFIIFCLVTITLIVLTVHSLIHKKYLNIFIPGALFLPIHYGIEFNSTLPILSVSRIMTIILYIYAYINRRRNINIRSVNFRLIPKEYYLIASYFIFRLISNLYYFNTYNQSIKTFLLLLFEQLFVLIAIYLLAPTKEEIDSVIKSVIAFATILFVVGIFESYTGIRPFDALFTVTRTMVNEHYVRLGLLRATTTLLMPVLYGNICVLMLPLILYTYEHTRSRKYILIAGLDIFAIIHSGCRSDLLFLIAICGFYLIFTLKDKNRRILFIKHASIVLCIIVLIAGIMSSVNDRYRYFYTGSIKAVLNEVGFDFDLDEGAPIGTDGYGVNPNGSMSRTRQLSGILYTARINPIFGLGSEAQNRKAVQYYFNGNWYPSKVYDVGLVEIFCNEGLLGLLGVISILTYLFVIARKNKYCMLALFTYLLSTLATGNIYTFIIFYVIIFTNWKFDKQ